MTEHCLQAKELECNGKEQDWWPDFEARLSPANAPRYATPAGEIDGALRILGVEAKEVKLFLQKRGFVEERRHRGAANERFYKFCFPGTEGKGAAAWVHMSNAS